MRLTDRNTYFIGIDPPNAVAVLDEDGKLVYSHAFKKQQASTKAFSSEDRRLFEIQRCIQAMNDCVGHRAKAAIEGPGVAGKIGFRGMWTIGHWAGVWRGLLSTLDILSVIVLPREWKQAMFPGIQLSKSKDTAMAYATQHYGITNEDEAEAVCIAEYLRRRGQ